MCALTGFTYVCALAGLKIAFVIPKSNLTPWACQSLDAIPDIKYVPLKLLIYLLWMYVKFIQTCTAYEEFQSATMARDCDKCRLQGYVVSSEFYQQVTICRLR